MIPVKVSVIVAVYKTSGFLPQCLDSLLNQSLKELEIICINDCSPDESKEVMEVYGQKDSRIKNIYFKENKGYPAVIRQGIHLAQGEYTYILDGDDWLEETALAELYARASKDDLDLLAFNCKVFCETPQLEEEYKEFSDYYRRDFPCSCIMTGQQLLTALKKDSTHYRNVFLYLTKTELLHSQSITMFSRTGDDIAFTFHVFLSAQKAGFENKTLHHYRIRENSGTTREKNSEYLAILASVDQVSFTEMLRLFWCFHLDMEKDSLIYAEIQMVKDSFLGYYEKINPQQLDTATQALENYENLLLGKHLIEEKE